MEKRIYTYLIQLNGKGLRVGKKKFSSEAEMNAFEEQQIAKYARNDDDLVVVMFR
jgi:hypothetical protein